MDARTELQAHPLVGKDWEKTVGCIPVDLESTAHQTKALQRCREVRAAADLLRLVLAYSLCDWSFRLVGVWAVLIGLAHLSDVAIYKRLRGCKVWLGTLVAAWLITRRAAVPAGSVRLRLIDATTASRPGSTGTDWRIHLSLDLGAASLDGIEVTDAKGGETLVRHPAQPGDIEVADRGYAHKRGLGSALARGASVVVRSNWQNLPLLTPTGQALDIVAWLREVPLDGPGEREVEVDTPDGRFALRLLAARLSQQAADAARRRIRQQAKKKGRTPDKRSMEAAGFITLVTNLPVGRWDSGSVLGLYRIRWQVEMQMKRLKGVLQLDQLRAQDPALAQVYLLGKLLAALLADAWIGKVIGQCAEWFESVERPVSPWRLLLLAREGLQQAVRSTITLDMILAALPDLGRYLRDAPRKRRQQYAQARALLRTLNAA